MIQIFDKVDIKYKKWYYAINKSGGHTSISTKKRIMKWSSYRQYINFFYLWDIFEIESEEEKTKLKCLRELIS